MSDDRPVETPEEAIARLQHQLDDFTSTTAARLLRKPTGDIELTLLRVPKPHTLFLRGATVSRATYPALWQWVLDNELVLAGLFGAGDGSTTFVLPNWIDATLVGAGSANWPGQVIGTNTKSILEANLPPHGHDVGGGTDNAGNHGGHIEFWWNSSGPVAGGSTVSGGAGNTHGDHWHNSAALWTHLAGSGTPFDVRQLSKYVNMLIWT